MNTVTNNNSKTLFQQCINLCDDYLGLEWTQGIKTNMFDVYRRENDLDPNLSIMHYGGDKFVVESMDYDTSKGCTIGTSVHLGTFDNVYDAQDCAEDYLKDLLMSQGV